MIGRSWNKRAWIFGASTTVLALASAANAQSPAPAPAPAQPAAAAPAGQTQAVQEIVITGFRNSLAKAISIKRQDTAEVDAILAEDSASSPT